jgi:hypothetical protein
MLGAQASGAQVKPFWLTIYDDSGGMNIGYPAAVSVAFGVADVMAELWRFSA